MRGPYAEHQAEQLGSEKHLPGKWQCGKIWDRDAHLPRLSSAKNFPRPPLQITTEITTLPNFRCTPSLPLAKLSASTRSLPIFPRNDAHYHPSSSGNSDPHRCLFLRHLCACRTDSATTRSTSSQTSVAPPSPWSPSGMGASSEVLQAFHGRRGSTAGLACHFPRHDA